MTSPISWSRSASVLVSDEVRVSRSFDVAALALQGLDDLVAANLLMSAGRERLEHRLEAVEQHVEVERLLGAAHRDRRVRPASASRSPTPWVSAM